LTGLIIEILGEYNSLHHFFKEIIGDIFLQNAGTALVLGALLLLMTELSRVSQRHQREAGTDPLTELFNRGVFFAEAGRVLAEARAGNGSPMVAVLDVDNMKEINDTLGHQCGDEVLKRAARAIQKSVREGDVTARYGGDEFVILFSDKGPRLETLRARLMKHLTMIPFAGAEIPLNILLGLARFPADGEELDALLAVADARMYTDKEAKKSCKENSN